MVNIFQVGYFPMAYVEEETDEDGLAAGINAL